MSFGIFGENVFFTAKMKYLGTRLTFHSGTAFLFFPKFLCQCRGLQPSSSYLSGNMNFTSNCQSERNVFDFIIHFSFFPISTLSKVLYLVLTCSNLKVLTSSRMCTKLKQILELNSLYYYSVLTCSNTFS